MTEEQAKAMLDYLEAIQANTQTIYQYIYNSNLGIDAANNQRAILVTQGSNWQSMAPWLVAAALGACMAAGCLMWMQVLRGKSQKNMW